MNEELKRAIQESGNRLHLEVANFFAKESFTVQLSPFYVDELTAAPREIDIIASMKIPVCDTFGNEKDAFWIHLVVECKHLSKSVAFYEFSNQPPFNPVDAIRTGSLNRSEIIDGMTLEREHHYVQAGNTTARLYELERGEVASARDEIYKATIQAIKALIFQETSFQTQPEGRALYYPIVIYDGLDGIFSLDGSKPNIESAELKKQHLYALQYAYRDINSSSVRKEWFMIDFVHVSALPDLLTNIRKDQLNLSKGMEFRLHL